VHVHRDSAAMSRLDDARPSKERGNLVSESYRSIDEARQSFVPAALEHRRCGALLCRTRARSSVFRCTASLRRCTSSVPSRHCFGSLVYVQRCRETLLRVARRHAAVRREVASGRSWTCSGPARGWFRSPVGVQRSCERLLPVAGGRAAVRRKIVTGRR
jgi:hypothetical protein